MQKNLAIYLANSIHDVVKYPKYAPNLTKLLHAWILDQYHDGSSFFEDENVKSVLSKGGDLDVYSKVGIDDGLDVMYIRVFGYCQGFCYLVDYNAIIDLLNG